MVYQIKAVDADNHTFSYSVIEVDLSGDVLEKLSYETKIVAGSDGGGAVKTTCKRHPQGRP